MTAHRSLLLLALLAPALLASSCPVLELVPSVNADLDGDAIVSDADLALLLACSGADPAVETACADSDVDRDGDVDLWDLAQAWRLLGRTICNGSTQLCDRSFDAVAYATTHNSFTNTVEGWFLPNNELPIPDQLSDGIRAFMLDTHYYDDGLLNGVHLCHGVGFCGLGSVPFAFELSRIKGYLDTHRGVVVTIILESYVSAADTAAVFEEVGLLDPADPSGDRLYEHSGGAWPSLGELVARGEQVVVLTDDRPSAAEQVLFPWHHYLWDTLAFETPFAITPAEFPITGFTCADNRGAPSNDLFILNHFLTNSVGHQTFAEMVNHNPFFLARARECEAFYGRIPNFVTVDFHNIGNVLNVVAALNTP